VPNVQRDCPPSSKVCKVRTGARAKASVPAASPAPVRPDTPRAKRGASARPGKTVSQALAASLVVPLLPHEAALAAQTWPEPQADRSAEPTREIPYANPPPASRKNRKSRSPLSSPRKPSPKLQPAPRHKVRARKPRLAPEVDFSPLSPLPEIDISLSVIYRAELSRQPLAWLGAMLRRMLMRLSRIRPRADRRLIYHASRRYRQLLHEAESAASLIVPSA
jgi:hypothetical protein